MKRKYKTLNTAIQSMISYSNFIESDNPYLEFDYASCDIDVLKVFFSTFLLTQFIESYVKVDGDRITTNLGEEYIDLAMKTIATHHPNGCYSFGELFYKDSLTALIKIRNKLAHGDFFIRSEEDGKYVIFEEHNVEGKVKVDNLVSFISTIEIELDKFEKLSARTRYYTTLEYGKVRKIHDNSSFDEQTRRMLSIKVIDYPMFPFTRTPQYITKREEVYNFISNNLKINMSAEDVRNRIEPKLKELEGYHANVELKITNLMEEDFYDGLKYNLLHNELFLSMHKINQYNAITMKAGDLQKGRFEQFNTRKGTILNLVFLNTLGKLTECNQKQLFEINAPSMRVILNHMRDILMTPILVSFNVLYQYGLEKEFSNINNYSLISILDDEVLDFSKFDLSKFESDTCVIEKELKEFDTEIDRKEKEEIDDILYRMELIKKIIDNYKENSKADEEKKKVFISEKELELLSIESEMDEVRVKYNTYRDKEKLFDKEKYIKNFNIITHIRNAIAHGNIVCDAYNPIPADTTIIIREYDVNNNLVYEKELKLLDFNTLFLMDNYIEIDKFIKRHMDITNKLLLML